MRFPVLPGRASWLSLRVRVFRLRGFATLASAAWFFLAIWIAASVFSPPPVHADDEWGPESPAVPTGPGRPTGAAPAPPQSSIGKKVQALKEKAGQLYRAKRYQDAGRVYAGILALDSMDASACNNLGLCYLKRGFKDSALEATRRALGLADRSLARDDAATWSFPDLRARKTAYFNLDKLGSPMPVPRPGQCETWSSFSACRGRLHVCVESGKRPQEGGTLHWDVLRVGLSRARARFSPDEVETASQVPHPELRDMEELAIDGVPESKSRWMNRDSSVALPLGEFLETADSACTGNCGNLEKVANECRVIHFDPCAGVVGMACGVEEEGGRDRILIGEFYLIPAE